MRKSLSEVHTGPVNDASENFSALRLEFRCGCPGYNIHDFTVGSLEPKMRCDKGESLHLDMTFKGSEENQAKTWEKLLSLISRANHFQTFDRNDEIIALLINQLLRETITDRVPVTPFIGTKTLLRLLFESNGNSMFIPIIDALTERHKEFQLSGGTALELLGYGFLLSELDANQESYQTDEIIIPLLRDLLELPDGRFRFEFPISVREWHRIAMAMDERSVELREMVRVAHNAHRGIFADVATEERYRKVLQTRTRYKNARHKSKDSEDKLNPYVSLFQAPYWVYYPKRWGKRSGWKKSED